MPNELPVELFAFSDKNVSFCKTDKVLIIGIAPATTPYKPFELAVERDKNGKDTGWYTVPKSLVFAHRTEKLADGSRLNIIRTREVPFAERKALFERGIEAGLKVRPVEEKAAKPEKVHLTMDALVGMKSAGAANAVPIPANPLHVKL